MTAILAGLAFGIVGSGHCAAMCGPLVLLANPRPAGLGTAGSASRGDLIGHAALYHGGRLFTYLVLGLVAGLAGSAMARLGLARGLAVAAGIALVLQALAATRWMTALGARAPLAGLHVTGRLVSGVTRALGTAGTWMRGHRVQGPVVFGALNGLLPCGLVYAALTAAAGFGELTQALLFMAAFAVGTTPVLAVIATAGGTLASRVPVAIRRAAPVALAIVGVLLIARGVRAPHGDHGAPAARGADATAVAHAPSHVH